MIKYGAEHFVRSYTLGDTTIDAEFPVWPSKLLVPVAFALWFLRLLIQLAGSLRLVIQPHAVPAGVVTSKEVVAQAQDEIHEIMGEDTGEGDKS